jgi:hypothetical protein
LVLRYGLSLAGVIERLRQLNPAVVVLFERDDTRNILPTLFRELADTRFVSIQSAWYFESAHLHLWWPGDRRRLKILTWGDHLIEQSAWQGRDTRGRNAVGSLEAALFSEFFPNVAGRLNSQQLCLVVKRKFGRPSSRPNFQTTERIRNVTTVLKYTSAYCRQNGLTAVMPVDPRRSEVERAEDAEWLESLELGPDISFSDKVLEFEPRRPNWYPHDLALPKPDIFRALTLVASSALTLGTQNSALIWQSLALGYPTLAVGFGSHKFFEFPVSGIWKLQDPSPEAFSSRVSQLRALPDHRFTSEELEPTRHLINQSPPGSAVMYLRDIVKSAIDNIAWDY